jgi:hypothetical protein
MKKTIVLFSLFMVGCLATIAQNKNYILYKGTMDGKLPITMYVTSADNECNADLLWRGMYKYDKLSKWLQLDITTNESNQFSMVEYRFTGAFILQKTPSGISGIWISPDGKRQLKVNLKEIPMKAAEREKYDDLLEKLNYENNDC